MAIRLFGAYAGGTNSLAAGEEVLQRDYANSNALVTATQVLRLTYFTGRKTETTTQVRVPSGGTAAGATPTLCRVCLYTIDSSTGDGTLVASIANDTALWSVANTGYTRSWSASYAKVAGQRYALGILVVTAAATPTFPGDSIAAGALAETAIDPRLCASLSGQSDVPASFSAGALSNTGQRFYAAILP